MLFVIKAKEKLCNCFITTVGTNFLTDYKYREKNKIFFKR